MDDNLFHLFFSSFDFIMIGGASFTQFCASILRGGRMAVVQIAIDFILANFAFKCFAAALKIWKLRIKNLMAKNSLHIRQSLCVFWMDSWWHCPEHFDPNRYIFRCIHSMDHKSQRIDSDVAFSRVIWAKNNIVVIDHKNEKKTCKYECRVKLPITMKAIRARTFKDLN